MCWTPSLWFSSSSPVSLFILTLMVNPWYRWMCFCTTVVGEIIVPTSAQYIVSTIVHFTSFESHGRSRLLVHTIATSSTLTLPIWYGSISSYATRRSFWSVSFNFLVYRFGLYLCIYWTSGRLLVICLALMVLHVRHPFIYEAYHPIFVKSLHQTLCLLRRYFLVFCLYLW